MYHWTKKHFYSLNYCLWQILDELLNLFSIILLVDRNKVAGKLYKVTEQKSQFCIRNKVAEIVMGNNVAA